MSRVTGLLAAPGRGVHGTSVGWWMLGILAGCVSQLSGCAVYHARALPTAPDLARAPALMVPVRTLGLPGLKPQPLDPSKGLTQTNVITLAVEDNPRLQALRLQAGVARAQLLAAGLVPDPQISGGLSKSSLFTGYTASLAQDIRALVTRGAAKGAARAHVNQVNLDILWQEWQVAERARELCIETRALGELRAVLDQRRTLLARLYRRDEASLGLHFIGVRDVTADYTAWNSAEADWRAFELKDNQTRHALDELLGLGPEVRLRLRGPLNEPHLSATQYHSALEQLPHRRPDLLALQAGYKSEDERLREAILAQFPLMSAGVEEAKDPQEGIRSVGFNVTITLPLFNRNRGAIAVANASRAYLSQSYQASLDETTSQANQVWAAVMIMQRQLKTLDHRLAGLEQAATAAKNALGRGTLSLSDYTRVAANAAATQVEVIELRASLEQARAGLAVLLALPF